MMTNATISADTIDGTPRPVGIDIHVAGNMSITADTKSAITARTPGASDAGEIRIEAGMLDTVSNLPFGVAMIDSHTSGLGKGGNVNIAVEDLVVNGNSSDADFFILTGTEGSGAGGDITLSSERGSFVWARMDTGDSTLGGVGSAGNLTLQGNQLTLDSVAFGTDSFSERGGNITLQAADIEITDSSMTTTSLLGNNAVLIQADRFAFNNSNILNATALGPGGEYFPGGQ